MSSNVQTALSRNDWHLDLVHDLPSQSLQGAPSIDDPVNDTDSALVRRFASKDVPAASVSCIENQSFVSGTLNPSKASLGNGTSGFCTVPDLKLTPGAMDASLACVSNTERPRNVTTAEKNAILAAYGYPASTKKSTGEYDHWLPHWMGGSDTAKPHRLRRMSALAQTS